MTCINELTTIKQVQIFNVVHKLNALVPRTRCFILVFLFLGIVSFNPVLTVQNPYDALNDKLEKEIADKAKLKAKLDLNREPKPKPNELIHDEQKPLTFEEKLKMLQDEQAERTLNLQKEKEKIIDDAIQDRISNAKLMNHPSKPEFCDYHSLKMNTCNSDTKRRNRIAVDYRLANDVKEDNVPYSVFLAKIEEEQAQIEKLEQQALGEFFKENYGFWCENTIYFFSSSFSAISDALSFVFVGYLWKDPSTQMEALEYFLLFLFVFYIYFNCEVLHIYHSFIHKHIEGCNFFVVIIFCPSLFGMLPCAIADYFLSPVFSAYAEADNDKSLKGMVPLAFDSERSFQKSRNSKFFFTFLMYVLTFYCHQALFFNFIIVRSILWFIIVLVGALSGINEEDRNRKSNINIEPNGKIYKHQASEPIGDDFSKTMILNTPISSSLIDTKQNDFNFKFYGGFKTIFNNGPFIDEATHTKCITVPVGVTGSDERPIYVKNVTVFQADTEILTYDYLKCKPKRHIVFLLSHFFQQNVETKIAMLEPASSSVRTIRNKPDNEEIPSRFMEDPYLVLNISGGIIESVNEDNMISALNPTMLNDVLRFSENHSQLRQAVAEHFGNSNNWDTDITAHGVHSDLICNAIPNNTYIDPKDMFYNLTNDKTSSALKLKMYSIATNSNSITKNPIAIDNKFMAAILSKADEKSLSLSSLKINSSETTHGTQIHICNNTDYSNDHPISNKAVWHEITQGVDNLKQIQKGTSQLYCYIPHFNIHTTRLNPSATAIINHSPIANKFLTVLRHVGLPVRVDTSYYDMIAATTKQQQHSGLPFSPFLMQLSNFMSDDVINLNNNYKKILEIRKAELEIEVLRRPNNNVFERDKMNKEIFRQKVEDYCDQSISNNSSIFERMFSNLKCIWKGKSKFNKRSDQY